MTDELPSEHWVYTICATKTHTIKTADCPWCLVDQLRGTLSLAEEGLANYAQEVERLKHRCSALAYLHYGHYLVQRDRQSVQADIEACESALTALRRELDALPQT